MSEQGNAPGNIVNLLRLRRGDLRAIDLSGLSIHQAYLQDVEAQDASLAGARLVGAVLDDAFGTVSSVAISRDGQRFAAGTLAGSVRVWRLTDRALVLSARGHRSAIWGVSLSGDGQQLASGGLDGAVHVWNIAGGDEVVIRDEQSGGIARVLLSADEQMLVSGGSAPSAREAGGQGRTKCVSELIRLPGNGDRFWAASPMLRNKRGNVDQRLDIRRIARHRRGV